MHTIRERDKPVSQSLLSKINIYCLVFLLLLEMLLVPAFLSFSNTLPCFSLANS